MKTNKMTDVRYELIKEELRFFAKGKQCLKDLRLKGQLRRAIEDKLEQRALAELTSDFPTARKGN